MLLVLPPGAPAEVAFAAPDWRMRSLSHFGPFTLLLAMPETSSSDPAHLRRAAGAALAAPNLARAQGAGTIRYVPAADIASLDPMNAQIVMDTLRRINVEDGRMVIANLHTLDTARRYCDRVIGMRDGRIVFDGSPDQLSTGVARDIYGADASFNESATSTAMPTDRAADDVYAQTLLS